MKKRTLLLFSLFLVNLVPAQEQALLISSTTSEKELFIRENKRIKIRPVDGQKIAGQFRIDGKNTIVIRNRRIEIP
ncbi:MAG: hypothetical protein P8Z38_04540 [Robiginitalea sp.]